MQGQYAGPRAAPAQQVGNGMGNAIVSGMPDQLQDRKGASTLQALAC